MTNFDLYRLLNLIVNKDVYANAMSDSEFDLQLKAKNIQLFTSKFPSDKTWNTQQMGTGTTRVNQIDLAPFFMESDQTVQSTGFVQVTGLYYLENYYSSTSLTSEIISAQEIAARIKSFIKPPTTINLAGYLVEGGLKLINMISGTIHIIGYRMPSEPTFKILTDDTTLEMTYDEDESVELEWNDGCKLDVLYMILQDMGVTIERQEVTQLANKLIQTGK